MYAVWKNHAGHLLLAMYIRNPCSSARVSVYSFTASSFHLVQALMEAVAMYDYTAAEDDELIFKKGQIIKNVAGVDVGWAEGQISGESVMFPTKYVEMREAVLEERPPPPETKEGLLCLLCTHSHCIHPHNSW